MNALLLVGSPKGRSSASYILGSRLAEGLRGRGVAVADAFIHHAARSEAETGRLLDAVDAAGLVVLAFPLYVDSLPAPLVRLLETIASRRARAAASPETPGLAAIVQCGFPEAHQCDTAVAICRLFAGSAAMRWAGALAMGMGGRLAAGIERLPGGGRHILRALELTAESLAAGEGVPGDATALFARPLIPRRIYTLVGNLQWRAQMRKNKVTRPMGYRPYEQG